jgi:hypothetical protein
LLKFLSSKNNKTPKFPSLKTDVIDLISRGTTVGRSCCQIQK